jgi:hypothetical protein
VEARRPDLVVQVGDVRDDVLDASDRTARLEATRSGWLAGGVALVVLVAGLVGLRPADDGQPVHVRLVEHKGSALHGQSFLRLYFSLTATGGDAELQEVSMSLGSVRQDGVAPRLVDEGGEALVLVDVVPSCPDAVQGLPVGTLDVLFRAGGSDQSVSLPLPLDGSLPRLVQRRCAAGDRV